MAEEELGGTFVIAVDELGLNGLWSTIKDVRRNEHDIHLALQWTQ